MAAIVHRAKTSAKRLANAFIGSLARRVSLADVAGRRNGAPGLSGDDRGGLIPQPDQPVAGGKPGRGCRRTGSRDTGLACRWAWIIMLRCGNYRCAIRWKWPPSSAM